MKTFASIVVTCGISFPTLGEGVRRCPLNCDNGPPENYFLPPPPSAVGMAHTKVYFFPDSGYTSVRKAAQAMTNAVTVIPSWVHPPDGLIVGCMQNRPTAVYESILGAGPVSATVRCMDYTPFSVPVAGYGCYATNQRGLFNGAAHASVVDVPAPDWLNPKTQAEEDVAEMWICTWTGVSSYDTNGLYWFTGAAYAVASGYFAFTYEQESQSHLRLDISLPASEPPTGIQRTTVLYSLDTLQDSVTQYNSNHGSRHPSQCALSGGDCTIQIEVPVVASGAEQAFVTRTVVFTDATFDANADGRFNVDDLGAINALIGSTDSGDLIRFDADGDGIIDVEDVSVVASLLGAGADSGLFGDANQDGVIDCEDRFGLGLTGQTLSNSGYVITMDFDLDGLIDASDIAAADAVIPTADVNRDGGVDGGDLGDFFAAFELGTADADVNNDGGVDASDLSLFFSMFSAGC